MSTGRRHSSEEIAWAKQKIDQLNGHVPYGKTMKKSGLLQEYNNHFGKNLAMGGLYTFLKTVQYPEIYKNKVKRTTTQSGYKPRSSMKSNLFYKANFILVVGPNVMGFDTKDEVISFIKTSQILNGVKLFVNTPVNISCNVDIGK